MEQLNRQTTVRDMTLCAMFTALIIVGAFIRIPIPYVPFTLQLLFTMLAGLLLGKKLGTMSVLLYIILGLIGVPVFTEGGGLMYIFKPSFGYIIGFAVGAYLTGKIAHEVKNPSFGRLLWANIAGLMAVYGFGMVHCFVIMNYYSGAGMTLWNLILYCFLLIVPGDLFLCVVAAILMKRLLPVLHQYR